MLHLSFVGDLGCALGLILMFVGLAAGEVNDAKRRVRRRIEEMVVEELADLYKEGHVRVAPPEPTVQLEEDEDDAVARNRAER